MKKSRRNLLTALGVFAPSMWVKPVVDSVILPAHAEISICTTLSCTGNPPTGTTISPSTNAQADLSVPEGGGITCSFITLCNGIRVEGPFSVTPTNGSIDIGVTPGQFGCDSGTFGYRVTRNDDGCTVECLWTVEAP